MEKRFRNKNSGDVVVQTSTKDYQFQADDLTGIIPRSWIEESNDWEEIKQDCIPTPSEEFPLFYDQLKPNRVYVAPYEGQGEYIFNSSDKSFYRRDPKNNQTYLNTVDVRFNLKEFSPSNGFHKFREATEDEKNLLRKVLLVTADGVTMYEGDSWWYATEGMTLVRQTNTTQYNGTNTAKTTAFSTKEKAEEWAKNNIPPLFITEDGVGIKPGERYWMVNKKGAGRVLNSVAKSFTFVSSQFVTFSNEANATAYLKCITPDFVTHDGVGLKFGTLVHWVIGNKYAYTLMFVDGHTHLTEAKPETYKVFSTQERAEKYVAKVKMFDEPVLSLNDVAKVFVTATKEVNNLTRQDAQNRRIQQMVKDKLGIK